MKIEITRLGVLPEKFQQNIEFQFISVRDGLKVIADETQKHMQNVIKQKTYRDGSTGNLSNSIQVEPIDGTTVFGYGVGNVSYMGRVAPYWYLMNYGGFSTIAARGLSLYGYYGAGDKPDASLRGTRTSPGGQAFTVQPGGFRMTPTAPVAPKNYIEDTANWASTAFRVHFSGVTGKISLFR